MAYRNLVELLRMQAEARPDGPLLRFHRDGAWRDWSYGRVLERVRSIAGGLDVLGVRPGERVAILSGARPEWLIADLGGMAAGAVVVGIDAALPVAEAACILDHVDARVAFLEDRRQAERLAEVRHRVPQLEHVVLLEGEAPDDVGLLSLTALEALAAPGQGAACLERQARRNREAPAAIGYTGGATGVPRGAVLTHGNILGTLEALAAALGPALDGVDVVLAAAPPGRVLGRVCGLFAPLFLGRTSACARADAGLVEDAAELRPHAIVAGPRALRDARDRLRGRRVRRRLGGRVSLLFTGGAPLPQDVNRFYASAGIHVCEGWGLAETAGPVTINRPDAARPGTVGLPLPGVEVRVAEDGELLVHGAGVFAGYHADPDATDEAFDANGFLRTGDVGYRDDEGFIHLTDRKKELIVTTDGRRIAPQKLEQLLRERPFIANALAFGHRRPFVVALLTPDRRAIADWHPELSERPVDDAGLHALILEEVRLVNDRLPTAERIRAFRLVDGDPFGGELSLLRRLRRREAELRHHTLLEAMYAAEQVAHRA